MCCDLPQGPRSEALEEMNASMEKNQRWLVKNKRKAFYAAVACEKFRDGTESLLQVSAIVTHVHRKSKKNRQTNQLTLKLIHQINV